MKRFVSPAKPKTEEYEYNPKQAKKPVTVDRPINVDKPTYVDEPIYIEKNAYRNVPAI
jgi:hypothetical protein